MTRRSPGDGTLFKRGDGLWVGGVEMPAGPDGIRKMKRVTAKNRNTCIEKLRKLKFAIAAGEVPTAPSTTVARWLEFWARDILPARGIKPSTITTYEGIIRRLPQHSIRHSTATLLMESHADRHVVTSVIGHTDITTTMAYQHVSMDLAREAWGSLSAILPVLRALPNVEEPADIC